MDGQSDEVNENTDDREESKFSHSKDSENGVKDDASEVGDRTGPDGCLERDEVILLMQEALERLGYDTLGDKLAAASGVRHQQRRITTFKSCMLEGDLGSGLRLFEALAGDLTDLETMNKVKGMIAEQQFLEVWLLLLTVLGLSGPENLPFTEEHLAN